MYRTVSARTTDWRTDSNVYMKVGGRERNRVGDFHSDRESVPAKLVVLTLGVLPDWQDLLLGYGIEVRGHRSLPQGFWSQRPHLYTLTYPQHKYRSRHQSLHTHRHYHRHGHKCTHKRTFTLISSPIKNIPYPTHTQTLITQSKGIKNESDLFSHCPVVYLDPASWQ